jgi:hypothetical protein
VDDIEAVMADLRQRGVVFEEYDFPGLKTVDGLATMDGFHTAWFRDIDGNTFSINQRD